MTKSLNNSYYTNIEDKLTQDELLFFKKELEEKQKKILENLKNREKELNNNTSCDLKDEGDHAFFAANNSTNNAIFQEQHKMLNQINRSLKRIDLGTYGICNLCEETINIERLKVTLFAEQCISCKELLEQQR